MNDCVSWGRMVFIDKSVDTIVYAIIRNKIFNQHFSYNIGKYMNGKLLNVKQVLNGFFFTLKDYSTVVQQTVHETLTNFREYVKSSYIIEIIKPLIDDESLNNAFIFQLKLLLQTHLNINEFYAHEVVKNFVYKEFLPGVSYLENETNKICYCFSNCDLKSILMKQFYFEFNLDEDKFRYFSQHADWLDVLKAFTDASKSNKVLTIQNATQFKIKLDGALVNIAYLRAFTDLILSNFRKMQIIHNLNTADLEPIKRVFAQIFTNRKIFNFFISTEGNKVVNISTENVERLLEMKSKIIQILMECETVNRPEDECMLRFLEKFEAKIRRKFPMVLVELDPLGAITIRGLNADITEFEEWLEKSYQYIECPSFSEEFYNSLAKLNFIERRPGPKPAFFGYKNAVVQLLFENAIQESVSRMDELAHCAWQNRNYVELRFDRFDKRKIDHLFEAGLTFLTYFYERLGHKDITVELCYLTNEVVVNIPSVYGNSGALNFRKHFILCLDEQFDMEIIYLLPSHMVNCNITFYRKLIEKLNAFKLQKEFEYGQKLVVSFEINERDYSLLKLSGFKFAVSYMHELLSEQTEFNMPINFDTSQVINTDMYKTLESYAGYFQEDKASLRIVNGQVCFYGLQIYYLCFNVLFEQLIFTEAYKISENEFVYQLDVYAKLLSLLSAEQLKQIVPEELSDCKCELRVFQDELVIQPSLKVLRKYKFEELQERYSNAIATFLRETFISRTIYLAEPLGEHAKDYVRVLNAVIRNEIERKKYEPLLVIVKEIANGHGVQVYGLSEDVYFVEKKLLEKVTRFKKVNKMVWTQPLSRMLEKCSQGPLSNIYVLEGRRLDVIFIQMLADLEDNGKFVALECDAKLMPFFFDIENLLLPMMDALGFGLILNCGKNRIELAVKALPASIAQDTSTYYNMFCAQIEAVGRMETIPFNLFELLDSEIREHFLRKLIDYRALVLDLSPASGGILVYNQSDETKNQLQRHGMHQIQLRKLAGDLSLSKISNLRQLMQEFFDVVAQVKKIDSDLKFSHDESQTFFYLCTMKAHSLFIEAFVELLLKKITVFVYKVSASDYCNILYKLCPQHVPNESNSFLVDVVFEYCNGKMLVYSYGRNNQLSQVRRKIENYLKYNECVVE